MYVSTMFIHSFIRSFVRSFIHSFIHSFWRLIVTVDDDVDVVISLCSVLILQNVESSPIYTLFVCFHPIVETASAINSHAYRVRITAPKFPNSLSEYFRIFIKFYSSSLSRSLLNPCLWFKLNIDSWHVQYISYYSFIRYLCASYYAIRRVHANSGQ